MNILSMLNSKKGFIGLGMLILSLVIIIMASAVLYNSFYNLFETGKNEENISRDYASLSSGIYYGAWYAKTNGAIALTPAIPQGLNGVPVNVTVAVVLTGGYAITATRIDPPVRTMTAKCSSSGVITAWD